MKNWIRELVGNREVIFNRYYTQTNMLDGIEYLASRNLDGSFDINTHDTAYSNIPYIGEFKNYREMDEYADWLENAHLMKCGFVCHVAHNEKDDYVFFPPNGSSYYISVAID